MEAQNKMISKVLFILILFVSILSCSTNRFLNKKKPKKIEIVINDVTLKLDGNRINNFIKDFKKSKIESKKDNFVNVLTLNLHYDDTVYTYISNGYVYLLHDSIIFKQKKNLIKKYWNIDEENMMIISKPQAIPK